MAQRAAERQKEKAVEATPEELLERARKNIAAARSTLQRILDGFPELKDVNNGP
jgi:hypothetical protein